MSGGQPAALVAEGDRARLTGGEAQVTGRDFKYGLLLTRERLDLRQRRDVGVRAVLETSSLDELAVEELEQWKGWIGSLLWEEFDGERLVFLCHASSTRPEVTDGENEQLMARCRWAWYAYQLSRPNNPTYGSCFILSGQAAVSGALVKPLDVCSWQTTHSLRRPAYIKNDNYALHYDVEWPTRLASVFSLIEHALDERSELPRVCDLALTTYSEGLRGGFVDFRVPAFVRAAETVLAVPRHGGARRFAERGARFIRDAGMDPMLVGRDIEADLRNVYRLRNDCVHGKVPFRELEERDQLSDVHLFEYLAELLANRATQWALRNERFLRGLPNREALEAAWASGVSPIPGSGGGG